MNVSELAKHVGVTPGVVRYYTQLGLVNPRKGNNGYRIYNQRDVRYLKFITQAKALGFTLKEVGTILKEAEAGNSPCPQVRTILERRLKETREKVLELTLLQQRMEEAMQQWEAIDDAVPGGESICVLIESTTKD